jgi:hypothetical protein
MKVSFQRFEAVQQALGAVPLYPIAKWTAKDDDETAFCLVKLDLRTKPTVYDSPKFSQYFKVFEHGTQLLNKTAVGVNQHISRRLIK